MIYNKCSSNLQITFLKKIVENTSDIMFVKDVNSIYLCASKSFAQMVGFSDADSMVGKTDFEIFNDENLAIRYYNDDRELLTLGKDKNNYIEPLPSYDGKTRYSTTSKFIIKDENNNPIAILGIGKYISIEYKLRQEYEQELSYLLDFTKDTIYTCLIDIDDWRIVDSRHKDLNNGTTQKYNLIKDFAFDESRLVVEDKNVKLFFETLSKESLYLLFKNNQCHFNFEYLRNYSFEEKSMKQWVRVRVHILKDPISDHLSASFTLTEISLEKRFELHKSKNPKFKQEDFIDILDNYTSVGVLCIKLTTNENAPLYYINNYLLELAGYTREEFTNKFKNNVLKILDDDFYNLALNFLNKLKENKKEKENNFSFRLTRPNGTFLWLNDHIKYIKLADGEEILLGILTDITDIKTKQQDAEKLADNLASQKDAISRMADLDIMTGLLNRDATMRKSTIIF